MFDLPLGGKYNTLWSKNRVENASLDRNLLIYYLTQLHLILSKLYGCLQCSRLGVSTAKNRQILSTLLKFTVRWGEASIEVATMKEKT